MINKHLSKTPTVDNTSCSIESSIEKVQDILNTMPIHKKIPDSAISCIKAFSKTHTSKSSNKNIT